MHVYMQDAVSRDVTRRQAYNIWRAQEKAAVTDLIRTFAAADVERERGRKETARKIAGKLIVQVFEAEGTRADMHVRLEHDPSGVCRTGGGFASRCNWV